MPSPISCISSQTPKLYELCITTTIILISTFFFFQTKERKTKSSIIAPRTCSQLVAQLGIRTKAFWLQTLHFHRYTQHLCTQELSANHLKQCTSLSCAVVVITSSLHQLCPTQEYLELCLSWVSYQAGLPFRSSLHGQIPSPATSLLITPARDNLCSLSPGSSFVCQLY